MAGLVGHAFLIGEQQAALSAFALAAITMSLLMFFLAMLVAGARGRLLGSLRDHAPRIKRGAGWTLVLVGAWLVMAAIWAEPISRHLLP